MLWAMNEAPVESHTDLLVLVVLANSADEYGYNAFPSVRLIAHRSRLSERTVQYALRRLEKSGVIKKGSKVVVNDRIKDPTKRPQCYDLQMHLSRNESGVHHMHRGAPHAPGGVHPVQKRGAPHAPDTNSNPTKKPTHNARAPEKKKPQTTVQRPDWCSAQLWADYKKTRKVPLTATAWSRLETQLDRGAKKGYDREDMLATAVEAGWRTIRLDWYENRIKADKPESSSTLRYLS